ncbi:cytochrome c oxidase assembly factor Coa1 family protein [Gilvimarinus sp. DA14]|uniref:cytochrome c oxidase assembly factor Coa1 family protein n=1 Tax=Gilvimarinus sp. DA14 TaxID=2956798 RepID=UPI0020B7C69C|nr:cytochrome c oxidase assembly factor Coa1 family protein [Gilvimarinus sp. DA14]UTF59034.1 cytochrome c oxidase assembly factor Coa1 family protein [Gilvimarinus sp. DA14]
MTKNGKIILASLSAVGFCGFIYILYSAYHLFRGDLYHDSLTALQQHSEIQEKIGLPLEPSLLFSGNYFFDSMFMQYEISGPKGDGWVVLMGEKSDGAWTLGSLWVQVNDSDEFITVIESEAYISDETVSESCDAPEDHQGYAKDGEEPMPVEDVLVDGSENISE